MVEGGSSFSPYTLKLTTVVRQYLSVVIVTAREDVEVQIQAPQTKTEHFWPWCVCGRIVILKNCIIIG
jgi:hypothetical protein